MRSPIRICISRWNQLRATQKDALLSAFHRTSLETPPLRLAGEAVTGLLKNPAAAWSLERYAVKSNQIVVN